MNFKKEENKTKNQNGAYVSAPFPELGTRLGAAAPPLAVVVPAHSALLSVRPAGSSDGLPTHTVSTSDNIVGSLHIPVSFPVPDSEDPACLQDPRSARSVRVVDRIRPRPFEPLSKFNGIRVLRVVGRRCARGVRLAVACASRARSRCPRPRRGAFAVLVRALACPHTQHRYLRISLGLDVSRSCFQSPILTIESAF